MYAMPNTITGYIYNDGSNGTEAYHCVRCGQMILAIRGHTATWVASSGIPYNTIAVGTEYLEHICGRCHAKHQILIQSIIGVIM